MSFAGDLIQSAREAAAIARGEAEPAGIFIPDRVDVAEIRKKQGLSQAVFAARYGLPLGTLRDWEQDRRSPDRAAVILLSLIDRVPEFVASTLATPVNLPVLAKETSR